MAHKIAQGVTSNGSRAGRQTDRHAGWPGHCTGNFNDLGLEVVMLLTQRLPFHVYSWCLEGNSLVSFRSIDRWWASGVGVQSTVPERSTSGFHIITWWASLTQFSYWAHYPSHEGGLKGGHKEDLRGGLRGGLQMGAWRRCLKGASKGL